MSAILQILFDALSLGSLYALGALGIALIFGVMRLVNFAHGDVIAFSIFALLWPSVDVVARVGAGNLPWFLLIPFVLAVGAGLSVLAELTVFRRFRNASPATMMIASPIWGAISAPKMCDRWWCGRRAGQPRPYRATCEIGRASCRERV